VLITRGLRTDLYEDGVIRPRGRNHVLTRRCEQRRDSETLGSEGRSSVEGRLVVDRATIEERDHGAGERAKPLATQGVKAQTPAYLRTGVRG